jgi:hypothetical protein
LGLSCGQTQRGAVVVFFFGLVSGQTQRGTIWSFSFFLFFWHNFFISYNGAHLRDLFQGLGLPLFGLWAHLTKLLVALIGPFWVHFETLEHA